MCEINIGIKTKFTKDVVIKIYLFENYSIQVAGAYYILHKYLFLSSISYPLYYTICLFLGCIPQEFH